MIPIQLPPLRERRDDIPVLVGHFVQEIAKRFGHTPPNVPEEVLEILQAYRWPGNVRELQNALERALALCDDGVIMLKDLPERVLEGVSKAVAASSSAAPMLETGLAEKAAAAAQWAKGYPPMLLKDFLHQQEVLYIERAIEAAGGSKEKASDMLGVSMATLYRKLAPTEPELAAVEAPVLLAAARVILCSCTVETSALPDLLDRCPDHHTPGAELGGFQLTFRSRANSPRCR